MMGSYPIGKPPLRVLDASSQSVMHSIEVAISGVRQCCRIRHVPGFMIRFGAPEAEHWVVHGGLK